MYWSNYHSHCVFCDGHSPMEDFVRYALAHGVKKYGFSSHGPLPFSTRWNMEEENFPFYESEFKRLKEKYRDDIELFFGLEVDFIPDCTDAGSAFYQNHAFDFLIGSIHYMDKLKDGSYLSVDGNFYDFEKGLKEHFDGDIRAVVKRYYEVSSDMIAKGGFEVVGHFDKIMHHLLHYGEFDITTNEYRNRVGENLELIRNKGMILEINTKAFLEKGVTYPHAQFYPLIHELQIPVTVNSDCHYPEKMTDGFEQTYKALKNAGFSTLHQLTESGWQAVEFTEKGLVE